MSQRPDYDDEFRASAVLMLEAQGYPERLGAMSQVAKALNVPARTLRRWFKKQSNPPPDRVVRRQKGELVDAILDEVWNVLGEMPAAREDASYRELGTVFGILVDKVQLLSGKATERLEINELSDEERAARIAGLLGTARARRDGRASNDHAGGSE